MGYKRIIGHILIVCIVINFIISGNAVGQGYRDELPIPPHEIFDNILKYNQRHDYDKITKIIDMAENMIATLAEKYNNKELELSMRKSISDKDSLMLNKITYKLILLDIKELFDVGIGFINSSNREKANIRFKAAFLDYLVLSPMLQRNDFEADQKIKNYFRKMVTTDVSSSDGIKILKEIEESINHKLLL